MRRLTLMIAIAALFAACNNQSKETKVSENPYAGLQKKATAVFAVLHKADTPENEALVKLGKALYFDNRLSKDQTESCNTCHNLATFGVDNKPVSMGDAGGNGTRNSPTTLNSGLNFVQFWDGRSPDVEDQAGGPILNPVEMAIPSEEFLIDRLSKINGYVDMFKAAFPEEESPITYDNIKKAIGAFERTLQTPSKFDNYLGGDSTALADNELKGLKTFLDEGCATCHSGVLLGGSMFQKFGLFGNYWDYTHSAVIDSGRYMVTHKDADMFVFKVPMLRNVEGTYPYFHDGSVKSLEEAVKIMAKTELNKDFSDEQSKAVVDFLKTLTAPLPDDVAAAPQLP